MVNAMDIYIQQLADAARKACEKEKILSDTKTILEEDTISKIVKYFNGNLIKYLEDNMQEKFRDYKKADKEDEIQLKIPISYMEKTGKNSFDIGYVNFDAMDILHELGHAFLELDEMNDGDIRWKGDVNFEAKELEATQWARSFIMPMSLFEQAIIESSTEGKCNIKKVSEIFNVEYVQVLMHGREMLIWE